MQKVCNLELIEVPRKYRDRYAAGRLRELFYCMLHERDWKIYTKHVFILDESHPQNHLLKKPPFCERSTWKLPEDESCSE